MKQGLIAFIIIIILSACSDHKGSYTSIDPQIKAHFNWQRGTYWVMQDTATGQIDSFYVASNMSDVTQGSDNNTNEELYILINEVSLSMTTLDSAHWFVSLGKTGDVTDVEMGIYLHNYQDFFLANSSALIDSFSHSLFLCGTVYNDVYIGQYYYINNIVSRIIFQSVDGFIYVKLVYQDYNHTWCLLRKNIIHQQ